jgi:Fe-S-cluster containining protein
MSSCGTGSNCDGRCCAVFHFTFDLDRVRRRVVDGEFIADMLVPLTDKQAKERADKFGIGAIHPPGKGRAFFTCKHWDEDTRLCTAYDKRPSMCRDYPYGKVCDHGCGYQLPLAGRVEWEFRTSNAPA